MRRVPSLRTSGQLKHVIRSVVKPVVSNFGAIHPRMVRPEGINDAVHAVISCVCNPIIGADLVVVGFAYCHDGGWIVEFARIKGPRLFRANTKETETITRERDIR